MNPNSNWNGLSKPFDYMFKIFLVGDSFIGKLCLVAKFISEDSNVCDSRVPTVGMDFKIKTVELNGKKIQLQIWDPTGQERFRSIAISPLFTNSYHRVMGIMLVYDITQENTFDDIARCLREIQKCVP
ncbi:ras-related protein Rab-8B-like [Anneissia japonica]|uniref:ras-related protein Rab-8B-like n=1 Tax=Anneissia japonica TaxID=1529436 RepID=UPI001425846B|nr:ras-related protein Rab-8B-like [Anneissia japonica]